MARGEWVEREQQGNESLARGDTNRRTLDMKGQVADVKEALHGR